MSKVVAIHGAFHEMWGPHQVRARWLPALQDGVWLHGAALDPDDVAIAFYGDVFRHAPMSAQAQRQQMEEVVRDAGLADLLQARLGDHALEVLAQQIGEDQLRRTIDQAGRYFSDDDVSAQVQQRLLDVLADDTCVVVAHSLGTVVAYETLCAHPDRAPLTLVTLGSPLANQGFVLPHLRPAQGEPTPPWPACVERWVNVGSPTDQVCRSNGIATVFGERVEDVVIDTAHRGHDPEPYLDAAAVGGVLCRALGLATTPSRR
jgi:pimeloyl-ACP methyl ester carboxylesterase